MLEVAGRGRRGAATHPGPACPRGALEQLRHPAAVGRPKRSLEDILLRPVTLGPEVFEFFSRAGEVKASATLA
jgi:hypothetical protein